LASDKAKSDKVHIRFEGKTLECRSDTTVAVALWENGIRCLSHSPKYGRPRGVTCARGHCTACLMRVDNIPNIRTCELSVSEGMDIQRQDAGTFYAAPMQKMLAAGSAFFPVGFYYKWFTRPATVSRFFLDRIRPLTGVGRLPGAEHATRALPPAADPQDPIAGPAIDLGRFDTVIVGAGPAGLAAAAKATGRVLVLDDHKIPGGQRYGALRRLAEHPDRILERFEVLGSALERIEKLRDQFSTRDDMTFLYGTRAIAGYHPDNILLRREDRLQSVKFDTLIWAAGALDTLGLFPGNDTPGVLGPRALYRLLVRDGLDLKGKHVLVIGGGLDFWLSAALLEAVGARPALVMTDAGDPSPIPAAVDCQWPLSTGLKLQGISGKGGQQLKASFTPDGSDKSRSDSQLTMDADLAVICNRAKPAYDIPYQLGGDVSLLPERGGFALSNESRLIAVGEAAGDLPGGPAHPAGEVNTP
jgi:sarcosine oxidase subunit alpha